MKDQRWPGDYQTVPQEFASARRQENMGLYGVNESYGNDYLAFEGGRLPDEYQRHELEPSWSTQLDVVGMQPNAREYVERQVNCLRSDRKYELIAGQIIDYPEGIQFSGAP